MAEQMAGSEVAAVDAGPETKKTVVIVESGDYEQRSIFGVYADTDAARRGVRSVYEAPYIVRWVDRPDGIDGHFEGVQGYSAHHFGEYDFTVYEVNE